MSEMFAFLIVRFNKFCDNNIEELVGQDVSW